MKRIAKILLISLTLLSLCGCSKVETKIKGKDVVIPTKEEIIEEETPIYIDKNPVDISVYSYNGGWNKVSEMTYSKWTIFQQLFWYNVFLTNDNHINDGKLANVFESYKNNYQTKFNYGLNIRFKTVDGEVINLTSKGVEDWFETNSYVLIYFYDAVKHRNSSWYSHTTTSEWNDSSNLTSFKICPGDNFHKIASDIKVTLFTYDSDDDFDEEGHYRGNREFNLTIKKA